MGEHWRLSKYRVNKILHCFCLDISASKTALLLGYNRKTIDRYYNIFRLSIAEYQGRGEPGDEIRRQSWPEAGFELRHSKLGVSKRHGQIFLTLLESDEPDALKPAGLKPDAPVSTGGWPAVIFQQAEDSDSPSKSHQNDLKAFWSFTKRRLAQFNGIAPTKLLLHLKECEFRFNNAKKDLFEIMRKDVLKAFK